MSNNANEEKAGKLLSKSISHFSKSFKGNNNNQLASFNATSTYFTMNKSRNQFFNTNTMFYSMKSPSNNTKARLQSATGMISKKITSTLSQIYMKSLDNRTKLNELQQAKLPNSKIKDIADFHVRRYKEDLQYYLVSNNINNNKSSNDSSREDLNPTKFRKTSTKLTANKICSTKDVKPESKPPIIKTPGSKIGKPRISLFKNISALRRSAVLIQNTLSEIISMPIILNKVNPNKYLDLHTLKDLKILNRLHKVQNSIAKFREEAILNEDKIANPGKKVPFDFYKNIEIITKDCINPFVKIKKTDQIKYYNEYERGKRGRENDVMENDDFNIYMPGSIHKFKNEKNSIMHPKFLKSTFKRKIELNEKFKTKLRFVQKNVKYIDPLK